MANDQQPQPEQPMLAPDEQCPPAEPALRAEGGRRGSGGATRPYRAVRRHRGDRRLSQPPTDGWECLEAILDGNLSWPYDRSN